MSSVIPESDWKLFKSVREQALGRFSTKALENCRVLCDDQSRTPTERLADLSDRLRLHERDMQQLFGQFSRSSATLALMVLRAQGLVDEHDLARFSPETQAASRPLNS